MRAPAPVVEFTDPTPAVSCVAPFGAPVPAVSHAAPAPVVEFTDPTPAVFCVAPFGAPVPAVSYAAPAPVVEFTDPTPAVFLCGTFWRSATVRESAAKDISRADTSNFENQSRGACTTADDIERTRSGSGAGTSHT